MLNSSIARKILMALSGLFLMVFLVQHFFINLTSVFSAKLFNQISDFMGNNPFIQFLLQPILIFGVIIHFSMGIYLEYKNNASRPIKYQFYKGSANASWASRNMIVSGLVVLAFLGLHFYDFWFPEILHKYVEQKPLESERYYPEILNKFESLPRTILYCTSFLLLSFHLWHGFSSSFQSVGARRISVISQKFGYAFALIIPSGFMFIALFHHFFNK